MTCQSAVGKSTRKMSNSQPVYVGRRPDSDDAQEGPTKAQHKNRENRGPNTVKMADRRGHSRRPTSRREYIALSPIMTPIDPILDIA